MGSNGRVGGGLVVVASVLLLGVDSGVGLGVVARAGGPAPVVTATSVGSLVIGHSRRHDVRAVYGEATLTDRNYLGYDCTGQRGACRTNFFFGTAGRVSGRLVGVVLGSGTARGYRTRRGVRLGMSVTQARRRDRPVAARKLCGFNALRYSRSAGRAGKFAGLTMLLAHAKIAAFVVVDPSEGVVCTGGGYAFA